MQREYVRLLASHGRTDVGYLGLYNEHKLAYDDTHIIAIFYLNVTVASRIQAHETAARTRVALLNARKLAQQLAERCQRRQRASVRFKRWNETRSSVDATAQCTRADTIPIVQFRTSIECENASAVLLRQANSLAQPIGYGFVQLDAELHNWKSDRQHLNEQIVRW